MAEACHRSVVCWSLCQAAGGSAYQQDIGVRLQRHTTVSWCASCKDRPCCLSCTGVLTVHSLHESDGSPVPRHSSMHPLWQERLTDDQAASHRAQAHTRTSCRKCTTVNIGATPFKLLPPCRLRQGYTCIAHAISMISLIIPLSCPPAEFAQVDGCNQLVAIDLARPRPA